METDWELRGGKGGEETERWGTVSDGVEKGEKRQAAGRAKGGVDTRSVY